MSEYDKILEKLTSMEITINTIQRDQLHILDTVKSHSVELWGDTSEDKPGLKTKIDRLITTQKDRNKIAAIGGGAIGVLGIDRLWAMIKATLLAPPPPTH